MKIYTFGCSWTYGTKAVFSNGIENAVHDVVSWVEELANMYPGIEFEDYSYPGTCIEYSLYLMNQVLNKKSDDDKLVFQFTVPFRYTTWSDSGVFLNKENRYNKLPNYSKFVNTFGNDLEIYTSNMSMGRMEFRREDKQLCPIFHKTYYSKLNIKKELASYYAITEYVKQKADFAFFYVDYNKRLEQTGSKLILNEYEFYPSVEGILEHKLFQKYSHDYGNHFNVDGCKHIADIVATDIGLNDDNIHIRL